MFDDLDDPYAPAPGPAHRAAVARRARRLRRRRAASFAAGGATVVLSAALVVYAIAAPAGRHSLDVVAPGETLPAPSSPPPARVTAGPSAEPTGWAAYPTDVDPAALSDDGRPGWNAGFSACENVPELPTDAEVPVPELRLALVLPARLVSGETPVGHLRIDNTGSRYVRFLRDNHENDAYLVRDDGRRANGRFGNDTPKGEWVELEPGGTAYVPVYVPLTECGDGPDDPRTRVPVGTYRATAVLLWSHLDVASAPLPSPTFDDGVERARGRWAAPVVTVRVE